MATPLPPDTDERDLRPDERELKGGWLDLGSHLLRDDVCARIEWLVANRLELVSEEEPGRLRTYRDPRDGRLWIWRSLAPFLASGGPTTLTLKENDA